VNKLIAIEQIVPVLTRVELLPTVVLWNRLEGRPRRTDFTRALRAELRDALWLVCKQWQVGEFRGDDAGSPIEARLLTRVAPLQEFQARNADPLPFSDRLPLETTVENRQVPFATRESELSLDLRLLMGRQWLKMIAGIGNFRSAYVDRYAIERPNPTIRGDAPICAHVEVWQRFSALAGRAMDGAKLFFYLTGSPTRHAHDGIAMPQSARDDVDLRAEKYIAWCRALFVQPNDGASATADAANGAWAPEQLEYQFSVSTAGEPDAKVMRAAEYYHGRLDWYNLDIDPTATALGAPASSGGDVPAPKDLNNVFIPTPLKFEGMPNTRWWSFEEGNTNFGDIAPDTHELGKLLLMEFALVYANDWFLVPITVPAGSRTSVRGLAVTNVFGERIWIQAAGSGPDDAWQKWRMYNLSIQGFDPTAADTSIIMLPTLAKGQEEKPFEEVALVRDEVANMVWGIEVLVPMPDGTSRRGREAALELRAHIERLAMAAAEAAPPPAPFEFKAPIRYEIMTSVPENWIPFVPVHRDGDTREIQLQRASMPRIVRGGGPVPEKVKPRTILLRHGLDDEEPKRYFLFEEEVPRAGVRVYQTFQRTRWYGGRVLTWLGVRKIVGRGEGSSGLAFDQIKPTPPKA
jgi:hypothetical protein